jgi:hypothetical protein
MRVVRSDVVVSARLGVAEVTVLRVLGVVVWLTGIVRVVVRVVEDVTVTVKSDSSVIVGVGVGVGDTESNNDQVITCEESSDMVHL